MKLFLAALPVLLVGLSSCDKAKQAADAVRVKLGGVTDPGAPASPGGEVAPDLASQVDSAAEGVRFRRDLPFPTTLTVRQTQRSTFQNVRRMIVSELGNELQTADGTFELIARIERTRGNLDFIIERSGIVKAKEDAQAAEGAKPPTAEKPEEGEDAALSGVAIPFVLGPDGWKLPPQNGPANFGVKLLQQQLEPAMTKLLVEVGVMPRMQWFSSTRRWLGGDKLVLEGESLALLGPEGSTGKVTLTYEAMEALEGHPCGRFAIEGDVSYRKVVEMDGSEVDKDITIKEGKIWCSLLYPVVLREEAKTVQTFVSGGLGGPKVKAQGSIDLLVARQWKP